MKCDNCGSSESFTKDYEHTYIIKKKTISFISTRRFCCQCENLIYDSSLDNIAANKAIEIYNKLYGVSSTEIKQIRKKYNLTQEQFAKIIGCAKKTLISYEKGTSIPNDNYMITLKALAAKPEIISTFLDASKDHFSKKEYQNIQVKMVPFLTNNLKQLYDKEDVVLSEYNGYTKVNKDKIYNMILYFTDKCILKTKLLKEMFYADFLYYKENTLSITGLEYAKLPLGPVPDQYEEIIKEGIIKNILKNKWEFKYDYECHNIYPKKEFDQSVFSKEELLIMKKVKKYFKDFNVKEIVDFSHEEKAFTESEFYKKINYEYAFEINTLD